jgi:hypothetical protein
MAAAAVSCKLSMSPSDVAGAPHLPVLLLHHKHNKSEYGKHRGWHSQVQLLEYGLASVLIQGMLKVPEALL